MKGKPVFLTQWPEHKKHAHGTVMLSARIPMRLHKKLVEKTKSAKMSRSAFVVKAIQNLLDDLE